MSVHPLTNTRGSQGAKSLPVEGGRFPKEGKLQWSVHETTFLVKACRTKCRLAFFCEVQGKVQALVHPAVVQRWVYPSAKYFVDGHFTVGGAGGDQRGHGALEGTEWLGFCVNFLGLL